MKLIAIVVAIMAIPASVVAGLIGNSPEARATASGLDTCTRPTQRAFQIECTLHRADHPSHVMTD